MSAWRLWRLRPAVRPPLVGKDFLGYCVEVMIFHEKGTLAVKEDVGKVEVMTLHEQVAVTTVHRPLMDLKYMVYMLQFQGTLAVKEEVVKNFLASRPRPRKRPQAV